MGLRKQLLEHLVRQLAESRLQLASKREAYALFSVAVHHGHHLLLSHSISCPEGMMDVPAGGQADAEDATALYHMFKSALIASSSASTSTPTALQSLLASRLPFDLAFAPRDQQVLLVAAACRPAVREVAVPLLHAAGAPFTLEMLLNAVDINMQPEALAALLACGHPAVDESRSSVRIMNYLGQWQDSYSCPIHALLRSHAQYYNIPSVYGGYLRRLELLLAAGYRPTVYLNVAAPSFVGPSPSPVLRVFDPFDFHPTFEHMLVFLARGGTWSPATHHHWPGAFKAAVRTVLLAGSFAGTLPAAAVAGHDEEGTDQPAGEGSLRTRGGWLAFLPGDVLLRMLGLAAAPMSSWL